MVSCCRCLIVVACGINTANYAEGLPELRAKDRPLANVCACRNVLRIRFLQLHGIDDRPAFESPWGRYPSRALRRKAAVSCAPALLRYMCSAPSEPAPCGNCRSRRGTPIRRANRLDSNEMVYVTAAHCNDNPLCTHASLGADTQHVAPDDETGLPTFIIPVRKQWLRIQRAGKSRSSRAHECAGLPVRVRCRVCFRRYLFRCGGTLFRHIPRSPDGGDSERRGGIDLLGIRLGTTKRETEVET